jgi:hypothetical protein
VLFSIGQILPPLIATVLTLYVLDLVPVPILDLALIPSQVATQAFQELQSPTQSTGQSVLMHVRSLIVSGVLFDIGQVRPPLIATVLTLYVLDLVPVPILDLVLIPSQVPVQAFQELQSPMQSTGQSVLLHVESVSGVLFAIGQVRPPLIVTVLTLYVLDLVPVLGAVVLIPSQVPVQAVQVPQSPTQSTGQSVLLHVLSVSGIGQVRPPLQTGLDTLYVLVLVPVLGAVA